VTTRQPALSRTWRPSNASLLTLTQVGSLSTRWYAGSLSNCAEGVDDILALLLALSATPEEFEVLLISVTYGNVELDR
jgi:hypothetical protein